MPSSQEVREATAHWGGAAAVAQGLILHAQHERTLGTPDSKQRKQIRDGVFERAIQCEYLSVHLLAPRTRIVVAGDAEVAMEHIDYREECGGFAVRNGEKSPAPSSPIG